MEGREELERFLEVARGMGYGRPSSLLFSF
jgi:hypothetical protein